MALRCILIPTTAGIDATRRLDASLQLGRRLGAHIRVLFISPEPHEYLSTLPEAVRATGVSVKSLENEVRTSAIQGRAALDDWCLEKSVTRGDTSDRLDAIFATWDEKIGEVEVVLAVAGRLTDITIVDSISSSARFAERTFDTAVFSTGRAVLVVPDRPPDDLLSHVVVAWNGSLEAAHAIGQSMDLLHAAQRVSIIQVNSSPKAHLADLGTYLRWHGIVTHRLPIVEAGHASLGAAILAETAKDKASMLVMGAYTHSRIRQFLLGGVTRHILSHATIPVLMAH